MRKNQNVPSQKLSQASQHGSSASPSVPDALFQRLFGHHPRVGVPRDEDDFSLVLFPVGVALSRWQSLQANHQGLESWRRATSWSLDLIELFAHKFPVGWRVRRWTALVDRKDGHSLPGEAHQLDIRLHEPGSISRVSLLYALMVNNDEAYIIFALVINAIKLVRRDTDDCQSNMKKKVHCATQSCLLCFSPAEIKWWWTFWNRNYFFEKKKTVTTFYRHLTEFFFSFWRNSTPCLLLKLVKLAYYLNMVVLISDTLIIVTSRANACLNKQHHSQSINKNVINSNFTGRYCKRADEIIESNFLFIYKNTNDLSSTQTLHWLDCFQIKHMSIFTSAKMR